MFKNGIQKSDRQLSDIYTHSKLLSLAMEWRALDLLVAYKTRVQILMKNFDDKNIVY